MNKSTLSFLIAMLLCMVSIVSAQDADSCEPAIGEQLGFDTVTLCDDEVPDMMVINGQLVVITPVEDVDAAQAMITAIAELDAQQEPELTAEAYAAMFQVGQFAQLTEDLTNNLRCQATAPRGDVLVSIPHEDKDSSFEILAALGAPDPDENQAYEPWLMPIPAEG